MTERPDEVCRILSDTFEQGMTIIDAKGYYSASQKSVIYIVLNRFQIIRMKDIVHETDPGAYISISEVADVFKLNAGNE